MRAAGLWCIDRNGKCVPSDDAAIRFASSRKMGEATVFALHLNDVPNYLFASLSEDPIERYLNCRALRGAR